MEKNNGNELIDLYKFTKTGYLIHHEDEELFSSAYLDVEKNSYDNLTLEEVTNLLEEMKERYQLNDTPNILDDLITYKEFNPVVNRIYNKLNQIFFYNTVGTTQDSFSNLLYNAFKEQYLACEYIENKIRNFYYYLLNKHISASNNQSDEYINTLQDILGEISFIYDDKIIDLNINLNYEPVSMENEQAKLFLQKHLKELSIKVLDKMVNYTNDELDNERTYAEVMSLQILLRSIFLIINDYNSLADIDDLFNQIKVNDNTTVNGIITTAFIANYHDYNEYKRTKEM